MERRSLARLAAKEPVTIDQHPLRLCVDAAVAHPRWIAGHDVEAAPREHGSEVDVV